jgi:short-subunit dehydrogenase
VSEGGGRIVPVVESQGRARYIERLRRAVVGRRVVLTGASSGIGRAFALQAGEAGAQLALVARGGEELLRVRGEIEARGTKAHVFAADLGDRERVAALAPELRSALGGVDVLIHNAALSVRRPVERSLERAADFARLAEVNYLGAVALTLGLLPDLLEARGQLVNISTIGVRTGGPNFAAYVASKAAFAHFVQALALELPQQRLAVTSVYLPLVRTPMLAPSRMYERWPALRTDEAARRIGEALIRRPARIAPHWTTLVETLHAVAPGFMRSAFATFHDRVYVWMERRQRRE